MSLHDPILNQYSPEEYAAFWGCDPVYDKAPRQPGDGYLMYNFSSEKQVKDKDYLTNLLGAIVRTIEEVTLRPDTDEDKAEDLQGLNELKDHVETLIKEL